MWHVSSRSGEATLRTAIHLLLTYLLTVVVVILHSHVRQRNGSVHSMCCGVLAITERISEREKEIGRACQSVSNF